MTNISTLNIDAHYPTPDLAKMTQAVEQVGALRARANALFINSNQYLPSWNNKATQLHANITTTDRSLRDAAQKMERALKNAVGDIANYQKELLDEGHDEEDKAYFVEKIGEAVNKALDSVKAEDGTLVRQLAGLEEKLDRRQGEGFMAEHKVSIERHTTDIEKLTTDLKALGDQRKVLNDGIDALKSKGFAEIGNDVIGDVEKLMALGMTPPQLAAVQLAMEQLKKLIAETERTLTFFMMLKALDNLVAVIDAKTKKKTDIHSEIALTTYRINFIETLLDLDTQRADYLPEAKKVTQATGFFMAQFPAGKNQSIESFIEHSNPFIECMNTIAITPH